jgi:hypothetical protein
LIIIIFLNISITQYSNVHSIIFKIWISKTYVIGIWYSVLKNYILFIIFLFSYRYWHTYYWFECEMIITIVGFLNNVHTIKMTFTLYHEHTVYTSFLLSSLYICTQPLAVLIFLSTEPITSLETRGGGGWASARSLPEKSNYLVSFLTFAPQPPPPPSSTTRVFWKHANSLSSVTNGIFTYLLMP